MTSSHASLLNSALKEWQRWQLELDCVPQILNRLASGRTNISYLIASSGRKFKLRLNSPVSKNLGIDRECEAKICETISPLGIAPKLLYSHPQYRYSVFEFVEGRVWTKNDISNHQNKERVADLISRYQTLGSATSSLNCLQARNYVEYFLGYEQQVLDKLSTKEEKAYTQFKDNLIEWQSSEPSVRLCHHDLMPENIIEDKDDIYILDWEYAAVGCGDLDFLSIEYRSKINDEFSKEIFRWLNTLWEKIPK